MYVLVFYTQLERFQSPYKHTLKKIFWDILLEELVTSSISNPKSKKIRGKLR